MKELNQICFYVKDRIDISLLNEKTYISTENMLQNKEGVTISSNIPKVGKTQAYKKGDILISNIRPYFKKIWYATWDGGCSGDVLVIRAKQGISSRYLYTILSDDRFFTYSMASSKGTKMPRGDKESIMKYSIPDFNPEEQVKISKIVFDINDKIRINNGINDNLHSQLISYYKEIFCNDINRRVCRADEYFDITIGKTPPRKEQQWFSKNPKDIKWFSIADMGKAGVFIDESSEYLTEEAIEKYNVVIVPENTLILSFKLTVGRVAITTNKCTTNEAIAHFKTNNKDINPYLYCYLKVFKYGELGSTSSIATAINSKIVKSMPFIIPNDDELLKFNLLALPIMSRIKINENENYRLSELRDTLLPKLMSGEIDVSNIKLDL